MKQNKSAYIFLRDKLIDKRNNKTDFVDKYLMERGNDNLINRFIKENCKLQETDNDRNKIKNIKLLYKLFVRINKNIDTINFKEGDPVRSFELYDMRDTIIRVIGDYLKRLPVNEQNDKEMKTVLDDLMNDHVFVEEFVRDNIQTNQIMK
jgi:hypothetical protein